MIRPCFWGGTLRGTGWLAITIDASSQSGNKPKINNIYPQNFTRTVLCIPSGYSPTSWNVDSSHMTCAMAAHTHVGFARTVLLQYRTNKQKTCDRMIMRHIKNNSLFVLSWCEGFSRVSTALVFLLLSTDCDIVKNPFGILRILGDYPPSLSMPEVLTLNIHLISWKRKKSVSSSGISDHEITPFKLDIFPISSYKNRCNFSKRFSQV